MASRKVGREAAVSLRALKVRAPRRGSLAQDGRSPQRAARSSRRVRPGAPAAARSTTTLTSLPGARFQDGGQGVALGRRAGTEGLCQDGARAPGSVATAHAHHCATQSFDTPDPRDYAASLSTQVRGSAGFSTGPARAIAPPAPTIPPWVACRPPPPQPTAPAPRTPFLTRTGTGPEAPTAPAPRRPWRGSWTAHRAPRPCQEALASEWYLAVLRGPDAGLVLPVPRSGAVGRGLVVTDPEVSRAHLLTRVRGDRVLVCDAGSTNGTRLRRRCWRRLTARPRACRAGARLRVGGTLVELRRRPSSLAAPVPTSGGPGLGAILGGGVTCLFIAGPVLLIVHGGGRSVLGAVSFLPMVLMTLMRLLPRGRRAGGRRGGPGDGRH